jgi:transcriptional/translational regulatory protein YebC/TACO1
VDQFGAVRDALAAAGFPVAADASGLEWIPKTPVELPAGGEDLEANERLYQKLLELTDVDAVFCSCPGVGADDDEDEE